MPLNLINNLDNFIGKNNIKENIQVYINSCIKDHHAFEHSLIYGLPGTGKTTLAKIIARCYYSKAYWCNQYFIINARKWNTFCWWNSCSKY